MRNRLINLHFHKEEISQSISLVKDGRLEFHVYLGDSSSEAVLRSRTRVDDGVRHRVVVSKHKVRANKDGKSRVVETLVNLAYHVQSLHWISR